MQIFQSLNKCKVSENFIDCEIFAIQEKETLIVNSAKRVISNEGGDSPAFTLDPINNYDNAKIPTYIKTNEFTWVFQEIVNTYGMPRYQEANPALFNIVTFPFLFGVMFGDIVHGMVIFGIGFYLTMFADSIKKDKNSMMKPFLVVRYMFLMMGFFAVFSGLIYNDFAATPIPLGKSCYQNKYIAERNETIAIQNPDCEYYFGIDHKWYTSSNELSFVNSLKMKLSVIFGVVHMFLGIVLKGMNLMFFNQKLDFIVEFIPQVIFFTILFVYMDVMIVIKWITKWGDIDGKPNAPGITSTVLNIILKFGALDDGVDVSLYYNKFSL